MAEIDYAAVLADLEARRAALDGAITVLRQLAGTGALDAGAAPAVTPEGTPREAALPSEVTPGVFHGLSVSEAARKYLEMTKTKQRTVDIASALRQGGIESTADNFYANVFTTLKRRKDFIKLRKFWALAEWYPTRAVATPKPAKKTARRGRKAGRTHKEPSQSKQKIPQAATGTDGGKAETA